MTERRSREYWEDRCHTCDLPRDSGEVEPELIEALDRMRIVAGSVLGIGCGTGTNAIELIWPGFDVVAIDVSQRVIDMATEKAGAAGIGSVVFRRHDMVESAPVVLASMDQVFDRGCFDSLTDEQSGVSARHVAKVLRHGGYWLCLCGNADEATEGGPPRLSA